MTIYTGVADANGDFTVPFSASYTAGQKVIVTASKDGASKSIELFAPSDVVGGGAIQFSGTLVDFPNNIGVVKLDGGMVNIPNYGFVVSGTVSQENIFSRATGLILSHGITTVGANAFQYWRGSEFITFPDSLVSIGASAFTGNNKINQPLIFPDSVNNIGSAVASGCTSCPSIVVGSGITVIPANAFSTMTALTKAEFKGQVSSMAANSCNGWTNCNQIIVHAISPPTITATTFANLKSTCIFKVPAASVAAYQAAENWSIYASRIQAI